MEELADEFMMSGLQEDPDTLEAVAAWQRPAVTVAAVDSTIKLLSSLFVAGLSIMAELSKSSTVNSKHSGVTRPHSSSLEAGLYVCLSK